MLDDNWNIGLNHTRIGHVRRNLFRISKVIEAQVPGTSRGNFKPKRTGWVPIFKKNCDSNVRVSICGIENAARLVAGHLRGWTMALSWNVTLRNCPPFSSDSSHSPMDQSQKYIVLNRRDGLEIRRVDSALCFFAAEKSPPMETGIDVIVFPKGTIDNKLNTAATTQSRNQCPARFPKIPQKQFRYEQTITLRAPSARH